MHYLSIKQLVQLYYNLIYPFISYSILAWGSACKCRIHKVQIKQNKIVRQIFNAVTYGKHTERALPLLNLLDILTVNNVYSLYALKFTYLWHKGLLPNIFNNFFQYASNIHNHNTRYASKQNLYKPCVKTNTGKQILVNK